MNPLYNSFQKQSQFQKIPGLPDDPMIQNAAAMLLNRLSSLGMTPEQKVRELIQNGQMSQQQFEALGQQANRLLGRKD